MDKIIQIAEENRKWAESVANYFLSQSKDRWFFSSNLCGMCAIASLRLFRELRAAGYEAQIAYTLGHVFVVYDNLIIDITATQFGYDRVFICELDDGEEDFDHYKDYILYDSEDEFLYNLDFPSDQNPSFFNYGENYDTATITK